MLLTVVEFDWTLWNLRVHHINPSRGSHKSKRIEHLPSDDDIPQSKVKWYMHRTKMMQTKPRPTCTTVDM